MKNTLLLFICVLALSLATTVLSTGGEKCKDAACHKAAASTAAGTTTTTPLFDLCMKTLQALPEPGRIRDVTLYTIEAVNVASTSYDSTGAAGRRLLRNASLPVELRAAYAGCVDGDYGAASGYMLGVQNGLGWCCFTWFKQDTAAVVAAIDGAGKLRSVGAPAPLYGMVLADQDMSALIASLSGLVLKH